MRERPESRLTWQNLREVIKMKTLCKQISAVSKLLENGEVLLDHESLDYDDGEENGYEEISVVIRKGLLYVRHETENPTGQGYVNGAGVVYRRPDYKTIRALLKSEDPRKFYYNEIHWQVPANMDMSDPEFV